MQMSRFRNSPRFFLLLLLLSFATEHQAQAYADPGLGALVWQMALAGFVGVLFYFRRFAGWIKTKMGSRD